MRKPSGTSSDTTGGRQYAESATVALRPSSWKASASTRAAPSAELMLDTNQVGISTDRQGIESVWDAISHFDKNEVRARAEGRFGYDVFSPAAIAKATLTSGE